MKRDALKSGMILVMDNGKRGMVVRGTTAYAALSKDAVLGPDLWCPLDYLLDDLTHKLGNAVVKVVQPLSNRAAAEFAVADLMDEEFYEVLWQDGEVD